MAGTFLIYGANGYTGELITRYAVERGMKPILAGRNAVKIEELAKKDHLDYRIFSLDETTRMDAALQEVDVVLHCAGPFSLTSRPMVEACLRNRKHYTDITGEIAVFEEMAGLDKKAEEAGLMIMPGVGFDVVPSDCLARHLKDRLPTASYLSLAFYGTGKLSHGTQATMTMNVGRGGAIRKDGKITRVPAAWKTQDINFGGLTKMGVTNSLGRRRDGLLFDRNTQHRGLYGRPTGELENAQSKSLYRLATRNKTVPGLSAKSDPCWRPVGRRTSEIENETLG
jgi:short subunit dehydrogenase-like uncharacterized protein